MRIRTPAFFITENPDLVEEYLKFTVHEVPVPVTVPVPVPVLQSRWSGKILLEPDPGQKISAPEPVCKFLKRFQNPLICYTKI
jgi:hypothetical protein